MLKPSIHEVHAAGPILAEWGMDISCSISHPRTCTWLKPQMGYWVLNCDGAMDDNRVGYSGLFRDDTGMPNFAYIGLGDKRHVLWVELQAIYRGVSLALLHGWYNQRIMSNSKLAVDILNKSIICLSRVVTIVHNIGKLWGVSIMWRWFMSGVKLINLQIFWLAWMLGFLSLFSCLVVFL